MDLGIFHFIPNLHRKHRNLFLGPIMNPSERSHHEALETCDGVFVIPVPELLMFLISWPRVRGPLEGLGVYLNEPEIAQDSDQVSVILEGPPEIFRGLTPQATHLVECVVILESAVITAGLEVNLVQLNVPSGVQVTK